MGDQSPESLIRAMLLSGPGDSFEDLVAPGARLLPFMAPRGFEGPEGAREYWEEARGSGWAVSIEIDSVRTLGGKALASGTLHARRGSIDQRNDLSWGARVKDGLIQEFCAFTDPLAAERWLTE